MSRSSRAPVCVVSPDPALRRSVCRLLAGQGHRAVGCASLAALVRRAASGVAGAIVDPGHHPVHGPAPSPMSRLRAEPSLHRCPVLVMRPDEVAALAEDRPSPPLIGFMIRVNSLLAGAGHLDLLDGVGRKLAGISDTDASLRAVLSAVAERIRLDTATAFLVGSRGLIQARAAWGYELDLSSLRTFSPGEGVVGWVVEHRAPTIVGDSALDDRFTSLDGRGSRSMIAVPLLVGSRVIGALTLVRRAPAEEFSDSELVLAATIGASSGVALENARLVEEERALTQRLAEVDRLMVEEMRLLSQIETHDRLYTQVVATVTHELKTPLTSIRGFAELLRDDDLSPEEVHDFAGEILDNALRLGRYVEGVLSEDAVHAGRVTAELTDVALAPLVAQVMRGLAPSVGPTHRLINQVGADAVVRGDADKLIQIINNLISNAVKYSPAGGAVRVAARVEETTVVLTFDDDGIGIPAEARARIFDRFYRAPSAVSMGIKGTGLGLSIVQGLVELHGGQIWVTDHEGGPGSRFCVSLSRAIAPVARDVAVSIETNHRRRSVRRERVAQR